MKPLTRWGLLWRSENKLDGYHEHLVWDWKDPHRTIPKFFRTRSEARQWKEKNYGYISRRPDLRAEPHGWKPVKVIKISISFEVLA